MQWYNMGVGKCLDKLLGHTNRRGKITGSRETSFLKNVRLHWEAGDASKPAAGGRSTTQSWEGCMDNVLGPTSRRSKILVSSMIIPLKAVRLQWSSGKGSKPAAEGRNTYLPNMGRCMGKL